MNMNQALAASNLQWEDASTANYSAESTRVEHLQAVVCLDDEGPLRPAYFWTVESDSTDGSGGRVAEGWASSVSRARSASLRMLRGLLAAGGA